MQRLLLGIVLLAVAAAPALAQPTWKLEATESTYSYVCSGDDWIALDGNGNQLSISGECAVIEIRGSDNRVTVEAVGTIRITGDNNDVRYARTTGGKQKPTIKKKGASNTVRRAE